MMPQYQMPPYYFNPMNNGYMRSIFPLEFLSNLHLSDFYPPPNFFMPGQMNPMAMPMNPINGPNTRGGAPQAHYKNSGILFDLLEQIFILLN